MSEIRFLGISRTSISRRSIGVRNGWEDGLGSGLDFPYDHHPVALLDTFFPFPLVFFSPNRTKRPDPDRIVWDLEYHNILQRAWLIGEEGLGGPDGLSERHCKSGVWTVLISTLVLTEFLVSEPWVTEHDVNSRGRRSFFCGLLHVPVANFCPFWDVVQNMDSDGCDTQMRMPNWVTALILLVRIYYVRLIYSFNACWIGASYSSSVAFTVISAWRFLQF